MAIKSGKKALFTEINITPLTDIFLVLLIIMMVIAPLLDQQGLNLSVPNNVEVTEIKDNKLLNITVTNDDRFFLGDNEIRPEKLEALIRDSSKDFPDGVMILAQPESTHGAVVKVMDSARNAGVTNVSITES